MVRLIRENRLYSPPQSRKRRVNGFADEFGASANFDTLRRPGISGARPAPGAVDVALAMGAVSASGACSAPFYRPWILDSSKIVV